MPGDVIADRYELEQLVGAGGMSSVFRAHDRVLERDVALKVLHERLYVQKDVVDRFSREARLVAGLSHQNIVGVIDRGDHDGRPFIVLEFVAGENLKQLVARSGPLPVARALALAIEIARGLSFAHQKGFVHRDVKPQNVLLNGEGEAKVTDFGIARPLEGHEGETATGTVLGSCDYISPEQAQGRPVDEHCDIYSLGIVLYELLTGEVPFAGDNFVAVAMQHINTDAPPVSLARPEVPRRVEAAVERALAKEPEGRFPSMAAFCAELEACLAELRVDEDTGATGVLPVVGRERSLRRDAGVRRPRRRRIALLAVALAIVAAIAAAAAFHHAAGAPSRPLHLSAATSYDPFGDHHENQGLIGYATDGNRSTAWSTEDYYDHTLGKPGVGIVLAAAAPVRARTLTVISDTPGYTAVIRASDRKFGPFSDDSVPRTGGAETTFRLDGHEARYYLIWITSLGGREHVDVNEVTATQ